MKQATYDQYADEFSMVELDGTDMLVFRGIKEKAVVQEDRLVFLRIYSNRTN